MSLFDTLRYPITNIYSSEELDRLPQDIYTPWIEWLYSACTDKIGTPDTTKNRVGQVQYFIMLGDFMYDKNVDVMMKYATLQLKEMIKEYEGQTI